MPPPAQRELRYQVTVVGNTQQAEQAFQRVAQNVDQVTKSLHAAQAELARVQAQQVRQDQQAKGWNPDGSYTPKPFEKPKDDALGTAAMLARVAFWTAAVGNVTDAIGGLGNSATGARQKVLDLAGSVPIIGDAVSSILANVFNLIERVRTDVKGGWGTYDARQQRIRDLPFQQAEEGAEFARFAQRDSLAAGDAFLLDSAQQRLYAVQDQNRIRFAPQSLGERGLGSLFGDVAFGQRFDSNKGYDAILRQANIGRIGAREARDIAQERVNATAIQLGEQEGRYFDAQERSEMAFQMARRTAERAAGNPAMEGELKESLLVAEKERAAYAREMARFEELTKASKEQQLALAQAEQQLRRANIGLAQAELQVVNAKLAKAEASAEQFGTFDPAKQQAVLRAAQRAKEAGYQELSPEQKQLLLGTTATADFARGLSARAGENDVLRSIQALVGDQDAKTLKAEAVRLQGKVNLSLEVDAQSLQGQVQKVIGDGIGKALDGLLEKAFRLKIQEIDLKYFQQRAASK